MQFLDVLFRNRDSGAASMSIVSTKMAVHACAEADWVFRDVVCQDVVFQNTSLNPLL